MRRLLKAALLALLLACAVPACAQQLVVQADQWCPYNCAPASSQTGYIIEVLQAVFEPAIKIKYEVVPWDRALAQAKAGEAAAVAATQRQVEENGLLVGQEAVGKSNDCLYVAAANRGKIATMKDIDTLPSVAIVSGYTYEAEFGVWLAKPANKGRIVVQRGENPAEINARNLALGRLGGVIENAQVMTQVVRRLGLEHAVAATSCTKPVPLFVAFGPKFANARQTVKQLDDGIVRLRQSGQLAKILARYGLTDWK